MNQNNPYYNPDEDADLLGTRSQREALNHQTAMTKVVEHMASEGAEASHEAKLISTVMGYIGHNSLLHNIPTILAALIDKSDETPENPIDLDTRWEFRQAEMQVQYCWVDRWAIEKALDETQLLEHVGATAQFMVDLLREYLAKRLEHAVLHYRQIGERLQIPTDEFFIKNGIRNEEEGVGPLHAKMLNLIGVQGGLSAGEPPSKE